MNGNKFYWDSSVFIAWLKNEPAYKEYLTHMEEYASQADQRKIVLVTSTLTNTEILDSKMGNDAKEAFSLFLKRPNVTEAAPDRRITVLASQIRDYYQVLKDSGKSNRTLAVPDAIHVATAIHYSVNQLHTFDDGKKSRKHLGLLSLHGNVAGHPLVICKPIAMQGRLDI
jgi:predicted nucleic acid-binding protein